MLTLPANRTLIRWILVISLLLFVLTAWLVFFDPGSSPDKKVMEALAPFLREDRTRLMKFITELGNHRFLIPANLILIAALLITKDKWAALTVGFTELSSLGLMSLLKRLLARQRPEDPLVDGITNFGFPSGHAFMSVAFYGLLILLLYKGLGKTWIKWVLIASLVLLMLLIGFTRIYLKVHYTTDVIAGYCIGASWLIGCLWLMHRWQEKREKL